MRLINKKSAPSTFIRYAKTKFAYYGGFDTTIREELLKSLYSEQQGLCAYCQQHLDLDTATIEHHCEQSICNGTEGYPDLRLHLSLIHI